MKAITCVYIADGGLSRFTSVKKRLKDAGHGAMSGAGYGAYGTEMVLTSATEKQARAVLDKVTFADALTYSKPVSPVEIK
jgi:hypothetical protein